MKIKDIVQEGFLDTLSSIGRGIAGSFGTELDPNTQKLKAIATSEKEIRPQLPSMAADQFKKVLTNSGVNLNDPSSYDVDAVTQSLQNYATQYFASANRAEINQSIRNTIQTIPLPTDLTDQDILQYLSKANDARSAAVDAALKGQLNQIQTRKAEVQTTTPATEPTAAPTPTPTAGPSTGLPANVSVLATNPMVLQVGKRRFELDDADQWHPLGSRKTVSAGEAAILNRYLSML